MPKPKTRIPRACGKNNNKKPESKSVPMTQIFDVDFINQYKKQKVKTSESTPKSTRDERCQMACKNFVENSGCRTTSGYDLGWEIKYVRKMVSYAGTKLVYVEWDNDQSTIEYLEKVKQNNPQELIKFYEEITDFRN